jgi:hypothetical protein
MKTLALAVLLSSAVALACDEDHKPTTAAAGEKAPAKPAAEVLLTRGDKLKGSPTVALADLLAAPQAHDGKLVTTEGTVRKNCERKGCWMELTSSTEGPGVRVTFKDYGFFVPLDSAGKKAKVEGLVKVAQLDDDTVKHYEGEGGKVARGKDGKAREVQLVASGVELRGAK